MSVSALVMASPNTLKRTFDEAGLGDPIAASHTMQSGCLSGNTSPLVSQSSAQNDPPTSTLPCASQATPIMVHKEASKKPKLTFAEKEAKRIEKEFKDQERVQEKAKKDEEKTKRDEEKAQKAEEKRIRDAEKEEKRKAREEQTKLKEEEKARKEDEKNKKARSQLRLNAFFGQPSLPNSSSNNSPSRENGPSPISSRRSSIAEIQAMEGRRSRSVSLTPRKLHLSDYQRHFPDFFLQSYTLLAPVNRFSRDLEGQSFVRKAIDESLQPSHETIPDPKFDPDSLFHIKPCRIRRQCTQSVKDIITKLHSSANNPIDLTDRRNTAQNPTDLLRDVPMKFLKFREDVRPPYIGTYTKITDHSAITKISRNPFSRVLPSTDYDYDSEAEWEELGEGEDLDSEGEEEEEEDEEDEMAEFLDDKEASDAKTIKRRPLLGDLEPTCTGLCWESEQSKVDLSSFRIDILMENPAFPIDPYATTYWAPPPPPPTTQQHLRPPRLPLNPLNRTNTLPAQQPNSSSTTLSMKPPKPAKRLIPHELLPSFKDAVVGSDLTKIGLVEMLKKQFPKQSKDVIRDTLDAVAERVGTKLAERRWVLK